MTYDHINVEEKYDGQITEIVLKPAPANIICSKMMDEILDCLKTQEGSPNKKLIIFSGEGKHFSFGASVEEHMPESVGNMLPKFHNFIGKIISCKIPTLAKVSGRCLGGGFELALACTFIFSDKGAKFAVPEIQLGVFPPPACVLLPFRAGDAFASQMILTGETFDAESLLGKGIINQVAEDGNLDSSVWAFIEKSLLPKSASSLRIACFAARMSLLDRYRAHISGLEELYLKDLMSTEDATLGIESFIEKQPPKWKNA